MGYPLYKRGGSRLIIHRNQSSGKLNTQPISIEWGIRNGTYIQIFNESEKVTADALYGIQTWGGA